MAKNTKYVSETTEFLRTFLKDHPQVIQEQKKLSNTWWDKDCNEVTAEEKLAQNDLETPDYPYFNYK